MDLDEYSKAIIEQLQIDGRMPYATIGRHVGLSESAVRQRVKGLTDAGVIQVVAVTDPLQVGFRRQAMVGVRVNGDLIAVAEKLAVLDNAIYVVTTAGSFDVICELVCEDDDQLLHLINDEIRAMPGVLSTETFVYLKLNKQQYGWGTR